MTTKPTIYRSVISIENGTLLMGEPLHDLLVEMNYSIGSVDKAPAWNPPAKPIKPVNATQEEVIAYQREMLTYAVAFKAARDLYYEGIRQQTDALNAMGAEYDLTFDVATFDWDTNKWVIKPVSPARIVLEYQRVVGWYSKVPVDLYDRIAFWSSNRREP